MLELNKTHHDNCLHTMALMPDNWVDLVFTSPPYNMNLRIRNGEYCSRSISKDEFSTKYTEFDDNLPIEKYNELHTKILKELLRVTKHQIFYNIAIVTGSKRSVFKMIGDFADNLKDIIIWDKGHGQPAMQNQVLNRRTELILVFEKDYPISRQFRNSGQFNRGTLDDLWLIKRQRSRNPLHRATNPDKLISTILENFSVEGDLIYDPFMGTGTTGRVAKQMNRNFIGSEINGLYLEDEALMNYGA